MDVLGGEVNISPGPANPNEGTKPEHSPCQVQMGGYVPQADTQAVIGVPAVTNRSDVSQTRAALIQQFLNTPISALIAQCSDMNIDCEGIALADVPEYMAMSLLDPDKTPDDSAVVSAESETTKNGE